MSDDDKPPEPSEKGSWSAEDRRMLLITFAGGLAANLGTVLIVGLALAFLHWYRSGVPHAEAAARMALLILVTFVSALGVRTCIFLIRHNPPGLKNTRSGRFLYWYVPVVGFLGGLLIVLVLVGLAAGVK